MAINLPDIPSAASAARAAGYGLDRVLYYLAHMNPIVEKVSTILELVQGLSGEGDPDGGGSPSGPDPITNAKLDQLVLMVSALDNEYSTTFEAIQGMIMNVSNIEGGVNSLTSYVPYMLTSLSAYPPDSAGVAAFLADLQSGVVQGTIDSLVLTKDNPTGGLIPVLNPLVLSYSSPKGDRYSIFPTLVDCLNLLNIYPAPDGSGVQEG